MNQDVYINIEEDSKWYELDIQNNTINEKNENKSSDSSDNSLKNAQTQLCQLCQIEQNSSKYSTIEQEFSLCQNCVGVITSQIYESKAEIVISHQQENIKIITQDRFKLYNIKYGQCLNCLDDNVILCKVGLCNHYFCFDCLYQRFHDQLSKQPFVTCFQCEDKLSDYLVLQFGFCSQFMKPKYYCCNKKCRAILSCEPYQDLVSLSIDIQGDTVMCTECRKQFCGKCWKRHKNGCDFEGQFKKYCKLKKIIKCPNCHVFCELAKCNVDNGPCGTYNVNDQQCPLCNNQFCGNCQGNLSLFENNNNEKIVICGSCYIEFNSCKGKITRLLTEQSIEAIIGLIFYLIVGSIVLFIIIGGLMMFICYGIVKIFKIVTDSVINKFKEKLSECPRNVLILSAPIWMSLIILISFIGFIILFVPITIQKFREFYQGF